MPIPQLIAASTRTRTPNACLAGVILAKFTIYTTCLMPHMPLATGVFLKCYFGLYFRLVTSSCIKTIVYDIFNAPTAIIRWRTKRRPSNNGNRNNQYKFYTPDLPSHPVVLFVLHVHTTMKYITNQLQSLENRHANFHRRCLVWLGLAWPGQAIGLDWQGFGFCDCDLDGGLGLGLG